MQTLIVKSQKNRIELVTIPGNVQADLSDYKPFEDQDGGKATLAPASSETVGGGGFAPQGPPPAYTPSGAQQNISSADFQVWDQKEASFLCFSDQEWISYRVITYIIYE